MRFRECTAKRGDSGGVGDEEGSAVVVQARDHVWRIFEGGL